MERIFQIAAVILIGVAAYFLWRGSTDGLFISGVLGAVCFFLSIRFQVRERMERRAAERRSQEEISEPDALLEEFPGANAIDDERQTTDKEPIKTSV